VYRTILVPLDGSPLAERALPFAQDLAQAAGARLILLRAVPLPWLGGPGDDSYRLKVGRDAEDYLDSILPAGLTGVEVTRLTYLGDPATMIVDEVRRQPVELIVMATHRRAVGQGRWLWGSVTDEVLRHAGVPVLVVPSTSERQWSADRVTRILIPLDGSPNSEAILDPARDLLDALGGDALLLRVISPVVYQRVDGYEDLVAVPTGRPGDLAADGQVERSAANLRASGHAVKTLIVADDNSLAAIVAIAGDEGIDAVALSTHGRGGLARLLMGSVATGILEQITVPTLLVRPVASHEAILATRASTRQRA
jgi:nucleotide-binding universal stress UspA family protein